MAMLIIKELILSLLVVSVVPQVRSSSCDSSSTSLLKEYVTRRSEPGVVPIAAGESGPIDVSVGLDLLNIRITDQENNQVELDAMLNVWWYSNVRYNSTHYDDQMTVRIPTSEVWVPDLEVFNGQLSLAYGFPSSNQVLYSPSGMVMWMPPVTIRTTCDVSKQKVAIEATCAIKMGSWSYNGNNVNLDEFAKFDVSSYFGDSKMEVLDTSAKKESKIYPCCPEEYQNMLFTVSFKKKVESSNSIYQGLIDYVTAQSNPDALPVMSLDDPIKVDMNLSLINIVSADTDSNQVEFDAWLITEYNSSITFDPAKFNGITEVRIPVSKLWVPDLSVYDGSMSISDSNPVTNNAVVRHNGQIIWVPPVKIRVPCDLSKLNDGGHYSNCSVKMGSWTHNAKQLYLGENTALEDDSFQSASGFVIRSTSARRKVSKYSCCPNEYYDITFGFNFTKVF